MSTTPGSVGWIDLTVTDAKALSEFYRQVCGWTVERVEMGGYCDYAMHASSGAPVAGVCHARGPNTDLPPQWLMYVCVADLEASVAAARSMGGKVLREPTCMGGYGRMAVVQDPAGAVMAVVQPPTA